MYRTLISLSLAFLAASPDVARSQTRTTTPPGASATSADHDLVLQRNGKRYEARVIKLNEEGVFLQVRVDGVWKDQAHRWSVFTPAEKRLIETAAAAKKQVEPNPQHKTGRAVDLGFLLWQRSNGNAMQAKLVGVTQSEAVLVLPNLRQVKMRLSAFALHAMTIMLNAVDPNPKQKVAIGKYQAAVRRYYLANQAYNEVNSALATAEELNRPVQIQSPLADVLQIDLTPQTQIDTTRLQMLHAKAWADLNATTRSCTEERSRLLQALSTD